MSKLKIILIILSFVAAILIAIFYMAFPSENEDIRNKVIKIASNNTQSELYIKKKVWGMTSDNQLVVISKSAQSEFTPDPKREYIYEGVMPLFYKLREDTLTIYTLKTSLIPKNLPTIFKIVQVELTNPYMMELIENDNYKKKGLIKID